MKTLINRIGANKEKGAAPPWNRQQNQDNPENQINHSSDNGNVLINGDNLLALKALEQNFTGKIKCIYIDPPYNTGNVFEHYDDGVQLSLWLNLITPRLRLLHKLLKEDGSIWISMDDNECHYLKILLDEIFGRNNFIASVICQKKYAPKSDSKFLSKISPRGDTFSKKVSPPTEPLPNL